MIFSERLKQEREKKGWSQTEKSVVVCFKMGDRKTIQYSQSVIYLVLQ